MSFTTKKFYKILLNGFRGVALTIRFSSFFHFGQISKWIKGVTPKKNWSKFHVDMYIYMVFSSQLQSFITILFSGFRGVKLIRKTGLTDWRTGQNIIPALMAIEQWGIFSVPHLLWHAYGHPLILVISRTVTLTPIAER